MSMHNWLRWEWHRLSKWVSKFSHREFFSTFWEKWFWTFLSKRAFNKSQAISWNLCCNEFFLKPVLSKLTSKTILRKRFSCEYFNNNTNNYYNCKTYIGAFLFVIVLFLYELKKRTQPASSHGHIEHSGSKIDFGSNIVLCTREQRNTLPQQRIRPKPQPWGAL